MPVRLTEEIIAPSIIPLDDPVFFRMPMKEQEEQLTVRRGMTKEQAIRLVEMFAKKRADSRYYAEGFAKLLEHLKCGDSD